MTDKIASMTNTYGLPGNDYGLVDKTSQAIGLSELDLKSSPPQVTQRDHLVYIDTRDCSGELSLYEAQLAFSFDVASRGLIEPSEFKKSLNSASVVVPNKLINIVEQLNNDPTSSITGFPKAKDNVIRGNRMHVHFPSQLKIVKSLDIVNAIIPRDIIPLYTYFPGFIQSCIPIVLRDEGNQYLNPSVENASSTWVSPVPETIEDFFDRRFNGIVSNKLGGVYETPLRYWRSYTGVNAMPNPQTPPPYQLWNPPQDYNSDNPWPFQPVPVKGQRIPTYRAKNGVVFSGYGLYDLDDFPETQEVQVGNGNTIQIPIRKLILKLIVPRGQYVNGISAESIIDNSKSNDFNNVGIVNNPLTQTGYGDYQRFIPGPGLGMNYQPNQVRESKSAPIDLSCSTYDPNTGYIGPMPVPFPNYRGNVWGPYGRPGDRFQNVGLQQTIDELYLNGDLDNLEGNPIIFPEFDPSREAYTLEYFVATLKRINTPVRFNNFDTASNPNIRNSMRVQFDGGYGAIDVSISEQTVTRGVPGTIQVKGLPNTQYDGNIHKLNPDIWIEPRKDAPLNWLDTLSGPQKPSIVSDLSSGFLGWTYTWRDIFPYTGTINVPITAGGTGPMEHFNSVSEEWNKSNSQWSSSPVIGSSNSYCIPQGDETSEEYVGNVGWGGITQLVPFGGGTNYALNQSFLNVGVETKETFTLTTVDSIGSQGEILTFTATTTLVPLTYPLLTILNNVPSIASSQSDENATFIRTSPFASDVSIHIGGSGYIVENNVVTKTSTGSGTGLTVNITSVTSIDTITGIISAITINNPGSGYSVGDVITVIQNESDNNALFQVDLTTGVGDGDIIPEYNTYHYHDPLATGASALTKVPLLDQDYLNGIDTCTAEPDNNCAQPIGEFQFCIGETIADSSLAIDDPRPIPNPPCLKKSDYIALESPQTEWNNDLSNETIECRPLNNSRIKQRSTYLSRRLSYTDFGANNGTLITALTNYRSLFISSTPDTDIVIRINQAQRNYTQSLNPIVNESNFFIPIRLSLGSTSGTLEYVEAVQGQLTSAGIYWPKTFYPPRARLNELTFEFFTYDGTPIPIERTLGFKRQFNEQAILFSASIIGSFIIHGNYTSFAPNLPPFSSSIGTSPASTLLTGAANSQLQSDPFDTTLNNYTQRNLSLSLRMQVYEGQNPGITHIIKRMPNADRDQFVDTNHPDIIPVASNIDQYGDTFKEEEFNEYTDDDSEDEY